MSGSATGSKTVDATGSIFVDSVLVGTAWSGSTVTYAFPTLASDYSYFGFADNGFNTITAAQKNNALFAMEKSFGGSANDGFSVEGFTNLNFTAGSSSDATLRFAESLTPGTAEVADFPGNLLTFDTADDGDIWFGTADAGTIFDLRKPVAGNYAWHTLIHELGHALGLKHAQENLVYGAMPDETNSVEFTVMSYRSFIGDFGDGYDYEQFGAPQTFMMADIAALQHMYGADYSTNSGATVYKWTPDSGKTFVNGQVAIAPGDNRIFATIWDGGGNDTYDLSAYKDSVSVDLRPGKHSVFDAGQLAFLGGGPNDGFARGNLFNALLFEGDLRSLIENAKGGSGNDEIRGNQAANTLYGNGGNDILYGFDGDDKFYGGAGRDILSGGTGNDKLTGGAGADRLIGGSGTDTASYADAKGAVRASLANPSVNTGDAEGDTYSSIANLLGSAFNDRLIGNHGGNKLTGGRGNDTLTGGSGADDFSFAKGFGKDKITDFQNNVDDIDLRSYNFSSISSVLSKSTQVGADVQIKLASTDIITLHDFKLSDLNASDFLL
ncbi:MAG: M10 family metallopeptidase [Shinella sp.]|uniref:M10 family metallopeptidase n=1 Tax=Shinella sp. TaxID=1870904 RepID=UPI0040366C13